MTNTRTFWIPQDSRSFEEKSPIPLCGSELVNRTRTLVALDVTIADADMGRMLCLVTSAGPRKPWSSYGGLQDTPPSLQSKRRRHASCPSTCSSASHVCPDAIPRHSQKADQLPDDSSRLANGPTLKRSKDTLTSLCAGAALRSKVFSAYERPSPYTAQPPSIAVLVGASSRSEMRHWRTMSAVVRQYADHAAPLCTDGPNLSAVSANAGYVGCAG